MTTIVNFKTDKKVKVKAQKVAKAMGLNLSDILNVYLRNFIKYQELTVSLKKDKVCPNKKLIMAIKEARKELKSKKYKDFLGFDKAIAF